MQLDLSKNQLCGVDEYGDGTYSAEGIIAIADALRVSEALTSVNVARNDITGDAARELAAVVLGKPTLESFCKIPLKQLRADELTEINLWGKGVGVPGALVLAGLLPVSEALTFLNLGQNALGDEGAEAIAAALKENKESKLATLNLEGKRYGNGRIGPRGAAALASAIAVSEALTSVDLRGNYMGDGGEAALREAVKGREGFKLMM